MIGLYNGNYILKLYGMVGEKEEEKGMDISGIEPEAFRMQSERDTTTPYTHGYLF